MVGPFVVVVWSGAAAAAVDRHDDGRVLAPHVRVEVVRVELPPAAGHGLVAAEASGARGGADVLNVLVDVGSGGLCGVPWSAGHAALRPARRFGVTNRSSNRASSNRSSAAATNTA